MLLGTNPDKDPLASLDFSTLFTLELAYVVRSLRRLGVSPADVEDLAHDVFIAVHGELENFDQTRPVRPWLFGFAFRVASNYRRKLKPANELEAAELLDPRPLAEEELVRAADRALVVKALESIPLVRRAVFILYEIDGVPIVDAARILEIPEGTAHSRLSKAREEFATAVTRLSKQENHGRIPKTAT